MSCQADSSTRCVRYNQCVGVIIFLCWFLFYSWPPFFRSWTLDLLVVSPPRYATTHEGSLFRSNNSCRVYCVLLSLILLNEWMNCVFLYRLAHHASAIIVDTWSTGPSSTLRTSVASPQPSLPIRSSKDGLRLCRWRRVCWYAYVYIFPFLCRVRAYWCCELLM